MKQFLLCVVSFITIQQCVAQKVYSTKTGKVDFVNSSSVSAKNAAADIKISSKTGAIVVSVLIKSFTFKNGTMQQHFNDNYMQSSKYPKAEFKGKITNLTDVKFTTAGTYSAKITGKLTMHGVTKDVSTTATITVSGTSITAKGSFSVTLKDYSISDDKISKTSTVSFDTGTLN